MGGIRTAKSSIQNCVGKRFEVWPENSSRSPKAGEGRVSLADIGPLFLNSGTRGVKSLQNSRCRQPQTGALPLYELHIALNVTITPNP
jgi:hypothetical protein